jgi:hypothetical protein
VDKDSSYFLGNWVLVESIRVFKNRQELQKSLWNFDQYSGRWSFIKNPVITFNQSDTLRFVYRILPFEIPREYPGLRAYPDSLIRQDTSLIGLPEISGQSRNSYFSSDLNQSGSLTRGFTVGSNQDFALESGLQFQLDGKLTDDVSITASLTDRSLPIQPDGSTQNLREFDRVFIQIQAPNTMLQMGDVDLSLQTTEFARINRRLQGANGAYNRNSGSIQSALSVARGTFKRAFFQGSDGVQGPYRLTGRNDEQFVIVLAGSERIFVNGRELTRGAENDYIIDYGIGEIYFTSNFLIKDESRIQVEYQYLDQDFTRTLVAAEGRDDSLLNGKLSLGFTYLREGDGDNLLSQRSLTQQDVELLRSVGDNLSAAVVSGADSVNFDDTNEEVLYARVDTLFNGQSFQIFRHQPGSPDAVFVVRFSRVEDGAGSYRRAGGSANGLLFEWVGPGNGNYEPFRQLPAPQLQQMAALDTRLELNQFITLYGELAGSFFDVNRFSGLDDEDNEDLAYKSGLRIQNLSAGEGNFSLDLRRRFSGSNFRFFDRTRDIEFVRRWNLSSFEQSEETLDDAALAYRHRSFSSEIRYGSLQRFGINSQRQSLSLKSAPREPLQIDYNQDFVLSEDAAINQDARWFRNIALIDYKPKKEGRRWIPNLFYEQEYREQRDLTTDSLSAASFSFLEIGPGLRMETEKLDLFARVVYRRDNLAAGDEIRKASDAIEQGYGLEFRPSDLLRTKNEIALRNKEFTREFEQLGRQNRRGLLIRSATDIELPSEALRSSFFYEVNTQRKAILQETYIEVGPELGVYTWNDQNGDGIQQIDEFFPELTPNEGTFVRQFLPSDELLPIITLNGRMRHQLKPFAFLEKQSPFLSQIRINSGITIRESSTTVELGDVYLLRLNTFRNDSTTIQGSYISDNELELAPEYEKWDLWLRFNSGQTLNRRAGELQRGLTELYEVETAYRPDYKHSLSLKSSIGINSSDSDRLRARNFNIREWLLEPAYNVIFNRSLSTRFTATYANRRDRAPDLPAEARVLKFRVESQAYLFRKIQSNVRTEIRNIRLDNQTSSFGFFELTEGLGEGTNMIWSVNASYNVSRLVRFVLNYDGRTVQNGPTIHTGRVTISAIF